jgi:segregation and condensation protein B
MTEEEEGLPPARLVEAALFTAGRPVGLDELALATGLGMDTVKRAVKALEMEYEERGDATALEVRQAGAKWAMQLKTVHVQHAQSLAKMEIPKKTLKTLALIAFHQPLMQSDLVDMIGSRTYDHVHELEEIGLVRSRPKGQSKVLTTSPEFPEYFGIPATDNHEIRSYLAKKVGLSPAVLRGETGLDAFQGPPATAEEIEQAARLKDAEKAQEALATDTGNDEPAEAAPAPEAATDSESGAGPLVETSA